MKSSRRSRYGDSGMRFALLLLVALFWGGPALAAEQYVVGCDFCHTMPPGDTSAAPTRDPATGFFAGNHLTHATSVQASCEKCHGATSGVNHRDGSIQLVANINTSPATGTYGRGTSFPQSPTPTPDSCANVNCHFETATPNWGVAALGAATTTTCATCHPALPTTKAHTKHIEHYGNDLTACVKCHPDHTAAVPYYAHATEVGRAIAVSGISYTGSNDQYLPSQVATRVVGSCASVACHSPGQGETGGALIAGDYATPGWGTPASGACGTCHNATKATLTTGSHTLHFNASGAGNCADCHAGVVGDGTSYASAAHVNNLLDVGHGYTKGGTLGNGYGTCSTAQCHGPSSPTWGANTTNKDCTKCHGVPTLPGSYTVVQAAPGYNQAGKNTAGNTGTFTNSVSNDSKVGAHDSHLRGLKGYTTNLVVCTDCHALPANAVHADGATNFSWSDRASNTGSLSPQYLTGTCSANYCHGGTLQDGSDTSPSWTDSSYLTAYAKNATNCGRCHGAPPTAGTLADTHNGVTIASSCATCHNHEGQGAEHLDGTLQAAGTCDSCHGYDTVGGVWGSGTHKDDPVNEGWGAHARHIDHLKTVNAATLIAASDTYGGTSFNKVCGVCHTRVVGDHMAGGRGIDFGGDVTTYKYGSSNPVYNGTSGVSSASDPKTCSNVSCHFGDAPRWQ